MVSIPPSGVDTWGEQGLRTRPWFALALRPPAAGLDAEAGPRASTTPKYGHLLPTRRPRATMAA